LLQSTPFGRYLEEASIQAIDKNAEIPLDEVSVLPGNADRLRKSAQRDCTTIRSPYPAPCVETNCHWFALPSHEHLYQNLPMLAAVFPQVVPSISIFGQFTPAFRF